MGFLKDFKYRNILDSDRIKNIDIKLLQSNKSNVKDTKDTKNIKNTKNNNKNDFFGNFLKKAEVEIFDERRDESGKNKWQRLSDEGIKTTSSTRIGAIIKHYSQKDFYVDQSCNILLNMLNWSSEDKKKWRAFDSERNSFVYNQGRDFEDLVPVFFKKNFPDYLVKNWNNENKGLFLKSYNSKSFNIYCRPDYFLYKMSESDNVTEGIIIEVKSSSSKTKRLENYKYQLALQDLLIRYFYPDTCIKDCLLFNDCMIEYSREELITLQKDILKYVPMFWEDLTLENYKKISVDEYIEIVKNK